MTTKDNTQFLVPEKLNLKSLDVKKSFDNLSEQNKQYAYHMSKASWAGSPIVSKQVSPESYELISFFVKLFRKFSNLQEVRETLNKFSESHVEDFLNYIAMLFGNNGNYNNFGDRKFIPRISSKIFKQLLQVLDNSSRYYNDLLEKIYDLRDEVKLLNYPSKGVTTYYSNNMTEDEISIINEYCISITLEQWNTRVTKVKNNFVIHVASITKKETKETNYKHLSISIKYGDFSEELSKVNKHLLGAKKFTRSQDQLLMLDSYIEHFQTGNVDSHKESQKQWINDVEPPIETNLGFIETYRDPSGVRAEYESFVAVVDVETSKKFKKLVDAAPELIKTLPWGPDFEKDVFIKPDFTSLEIVTFVSSGLPAGINIPNYDDVRQNFGFKNVSLGNIIRAGYTSNDRVDFLTEEDDKIYRKHVQQAFECDVAGHELLGHGSGKLLYNLEDKVIMNPLTGKPVTNCYKEGETYNSRFGGLSGAVEESRAEACGLFFSCNEIVQNIFGHGESSSDILYTSFLWMIRAGVVSLDQGYDADQKKWVNSHACARFVIYRVLSEVKGFIQVKLLNDNDFVITVDRNMILKEGLTRLKQYLVALQVYRSTGDFENCSKWFNEYSQVDEFHLKLRDIIIKKGKPRAIYIQPYLTMKNNLVTLEDYPPTLDGLITSVCNNYNLVEDS